ncbi:ABC transporter permease [Saccharothrix algeriensis]|uniref:ABC transporter permease n=1 Tax=Saccharothrix algeriensis TaxID=173560 RepID=A0A8T8I080_9PSEU|nr:ABC transporter permease [Saccharothrix algeriensis]
MFVAWRDLRFAKGRFALVGSVIVLVTLLVGLLSGLTAGLARQNTSAITGLPADRIAFAAPAAGWSPSYADSEVTEEQWRQWAAAPGVTAAHPLGIATTRAGAGGLGLPVAAFGVPPGSGLAPAPPADGRVVLSRTAADELGARPGDTVTVGGRAATVAAVSGDAAHSHLPVVWTTLADWQRTGGPGATVIALDTAPGVDTAALDARFGTRTTTVGDSLPAIGSYAAENGSLQLMRGFLFAISALVVGAFFTVWTIQRSGDIAVLKALGAPTSAVLRDALGQALVLLIGGTLVGTALAAGVGALVGGSAVPFALSPGTVLLPAAVMVALGALGAALSVRRITSVDPLTALGSVR